MTITIRSMKLPEDAEELANLFNAFNESWDGGFSGQGLNTAETATNIATRARRIDTYVAEDGSGRVVGYCSVHPHYRDVEAAYVGILGAHPDVMGQGVGKQLMLRSLERASEEGLTRLDLNTWAGNLKAMPLYKKCGLMWCPETMVTMEGYIPLILAQPLFNPFFAKHPDWYQAFDVQITQSFDEFRLAGLEVYHYRFVGSEGSDSLDVWVDRFAKTMVGFDRVVGGRRLRMTLEAPTNKAFRGVSYEVTLNITSDDDLPDFTLQTDLPTGLRLEGREEFPSHVAGTLKRQLTIQVDVDAPLHKPDQNEKGLVPRFKVGWEGHEVRLAVGLTVGTAVEFTPEDGSEVIFPARQHDSLRLVAKNKLDQPLEGTFHLRQQPGDHRFQTTEYSISLDRNEEDLVELRTDTPLPSEGLVQVSGYLSYKTEGFTSRTEDFEFEFPVLTPTSQHVVPERRWNDRLMVYNGFHQARVNLKGGSWVFGDDGNTLANSQSQTLGPPFGFDEFQRLMYHWEVEDGEGVKTIVLTCPSEEREGVTLVKRIKLIPQSPLVETEVILQNDSGHDYPTLELRIANTSNFNPNSASLVVPLNDNLVRLDGVQFPRTNADIGFDPSRLKQQWVASDKTDSGMVKGIIWRLADEMKSLELTSGSLGLYHYGAGVGPNDKRLVARMWSYVGPGTWQTIQNLWYNLASTAGEPYGGYSSPTPPFHLRTREVVREVDGRWKITFELTTDLQVPAQGVIDLPSTFGQVEPQAVPFEVSADTPTTVETIIAPPPTSVTLEGFASLTFSTGVVKVPTHIVLRHQMSSEAHLTSKEEGEHQTYLLKHPHFVTQSAPRHSAGITSLSIGEKEFLHSTFPEIKPSFFLPKDPGGIYFTFANQIEHLLQGKAVLPYHATELHQNGTKGLRFELEDGELPKELPDVTVRFEVLVDVDYPVIRLRMCFTNQTKVTKTFFSGFNMALQLRSNLRTTFVKDGVRTLIPPASGQRQAMVLTDVAQPLTFDFRDDSVVWELSPPADRSSFALYVDLQPVYLFYGAFIPVRVFPGEEEALEFTLQLLRSPQA